MKTEFETNVVEATELSTDLRWQIPCSGQRAVTWGWEMGERERPGGKGGWECQWALALFPEMPLGIRHFVLDKYRIKFDLMETRLVGQRAGPRLFLQYFLHLLPNLFSPSLVMKVMRNRGLRTMGELVTDTESFFLLGGCWFLRSCITLTVPKRFSGGPHREGSINTFPENDKWRKMNRDLLACPVCQRQAQCHPCLAEIP